MGCRPVRPSKATSHVKRAVALIYRNLYFREFFNLRWEKAESRALTKAMFECPSTGSAILSQIFASKCERKNGSESACAR